MRPVLRRIYLLHFLSGCASRATALERSERAPAPPAAARGAHTRTTPTPPSDALGTLLDGGDGLGGDGVSGQPAFLQLDDRKRVEVYEVERAKLLRWKTL